MRIDRRTAVVLGLALVWAIFTFDRWGPAYEPSPEEIARLGESVPQQSPLADAEPIVEARGDGTVTYTPVAEMQVYARVLGTERYRFDDGARYSPVDFALAWGPLGDPAVDRFLDWRQDVRFYFYEWDELPPGLDPPTIAVSSANMHMVPADDYVEDRLLDVRRGDVVELEGQLVNVHHAFDDGRWFQWRTSVTRGDTGDGACEIFRVERVRINGG